MNNREVCHNFSNMIKNRNGKINYRGSSLFCYDHAIYSYGTHFCMGFVGKYKGKEILFVNTAKYSVSTNKHQSYFRRSINENIFPEIIYCNFGKIFGSNGTDNMRYSGGKICNDRKIFFKNIVKTSVRELKKEYEKSLKAITCLLEPGYFISSIEGIKIFCEKWNVKIKLPEFDLEKLQTRNERQKVKNDIKEKKRKLKEFDDIFNIGKQLNLI